MRSYIQLCQKKAAKLVGLLKKVDKKSAEYRKVLLKLDPIKQEVIFVAGNATLMSSLIIDDIEVDMSESNENGIFFISFDADVLLDTLSDGNNDLDILLQSDKSERIEMTFPKLSKLRRAFSKEADQIHLDHFKILENDSETQYNKDDLLGLIQLVDKQCKPFECVLLNSEKGGGR